MRKCFILIVDSLQLDLVAHDTIVIEIGVTDRCELG